MVANLSSAPFSDIFLVICFITLILNCNGLDKSASMNSDSDLESDSPTSDEALSRSKRYLLWNPLSVVQITVALAVPFKEVMEKSKNVGLAFDIQGNYLLPTQALQLEPGYIPVAPGSRRVARDLSLLDAYKNFEEILYTQGFHGRQCLLQAICMAAEVPLSKDNFFEEIVHILLKPSDIEPEITDTYKEAQRLGESGADCKESFPKCQTPILDVISMLWHPSS